MKIIPTRELEIYQDGYNEGKNMALKELRKTDLERIEELLDENFYKDLKNEKIML